jgi:hypothetical protein
MPELVCKLYELFFFVAKVAKKGIASK